jgi:hypothetical protein
MYSEKQRQYHRKRYLSRRDTLLPAKRAAYDPAEERRKNLWRFYKVTPEEYDVWLQKQNGRCAICETDTPRGRWACLAVDHCHMTGNIRGLLCSPCNTAIGALGDNEAGLARALAYVRGANG